MSKDFIIKKCNECGALVKVFKECNCKNCGIQCCDKAMIELVPNSVDAAIEKHVPTYEIRDERIFAKVNHVMEEDHYIEWISIVFENKEITKYFKPGDEPIIDCKYESGATIYAYCNKHALWKVDVK